MYALNEDMAEYNAKIDKRMDVLRDFQKTITVRQSEKSTRTTTAYNRDKSPKHVQGALPNEAKFWKRKTGSKSKRGVTSS